MAAKFIQEVHCKTALEFIEKLRRSNKQWIDERELRVPWVFRGQWNSDLDNDRPWLLLPKAWREEEKKPDAVLGRKIKQLENDEHKNPGRLLRLAQPAIPTPEKTKKNKSELAKWNSRLETAALECAAHVGLLRDFALLAQGAGHPVHIPHGIEHAFAEAVKNEQGEYEETCMNRFFNGWDINTGEHFPRIDPIVGIAQHHLVATGLMDWSSNPLVAAYFAAERVTKEKAVAGKLITVFALHEDAFAVPDSRDLRLFTVPPKTIEFLDAQEGLFSWCPNAYHWYVRTGSYPTINDIIRKIGSEIKKETGTKPPFLKRLTLPQEEALDVLKILWRERVTLAHLMPTFDHVARTMEIQSQLYA